MAHKTTGIIIRKRDLSEADRLLTIYTKDFGKILVKAKAVKKSQAKLKGHLELFLHSYLMFVNGRGLDIVINAETLNSFAGLHNNLSNLAGAYCISELIDKLIIGQEYDENIWNLILYSFQELDKNKNIKFLLIDFSIKLLNLLGHGNFNKQDVFKFIYSYCNSEINSFEFLKLCH